jgi:hypothetical protein
MATKSLAFFYIVLLYNAGPIFSGVLVADLFLPFFLICVVHDKWSVKKRFFWMSVALLSYGALISLASVSLSYNSYFFSFALMLRVASFLLICQFFKLVTIKYDVNVVVSALSLSMFVSLLVTAFNIFSGQRAYYGYAQVLSTNAPAISAFLLGSSSVFSLIAYFYCRKSLYLITFFSLAVLCFMTMSLSGSIALIFSCLIVFTFIFVYDKNPYFNIFYPLSVFLVLFSIFIFKDAFFDVFYRVEYIFDKLDYRIAKVDSIDSDLCANVACDIFGIGVGSHSYHNNVDWGAGSILAFDQLYGRISLEWGLIGSILWILLFFLVFSPIKVMRKSILVDRYMLAMLSFGLLFGVGSEFIYVAYSGSAWAAFLGSILGLKALRNNHGSLL